MVRTGIVAALAALTVLAAHSAPSGGASWRPSCAAAGVPDPGDEDCDRVRTDREPYDNCPQVANANQANADAGYTETDPAAPDGGGPMVPGDGAGDACDDDDDADGVADRRDADGDGFAETRLDNCQFVRNPTQRDGDPGDGGYGDDCPPRDSDGDRVPDDADNCPASTNGDQADGDRDASGDVCDEDDDNDTVVDGADNCPGVSNQTQEDRDGDGAGSACDPGDVAPPPPPAPEAAAAEDRRPPRLTVDAARRLPARDLASLLPVPVRCDEACGLSARLDLSRADARRLRTPRRLAAGTALLGGAGRTFVFLRVERAGVRRVGGRGGRATLIVRAVDEAGNARTVRRRLVLTAR